MKQFNLNTPKNLPKPSPIFIGQPGYPSPFMSPYVLPSEFIMQTHHQRHREEDDFANFQLNKPPADIENQQQEPPQEPVIEKENDSDQQPEQPRNVKPIPNDSKVRKLVEILVSYVDKSDERLNEQRMRCVLPEDHDLREVYDILLRKFKKLKKTKEQMTKYCMRKAFKFLSEKLKKQNPALNKDVDVGLKHYFAGFESDDNFTIPFKKNSHEKTMNTNFLKKVFSSQMFLRDYMDFLKYFKKLVEDDNAKKIKYLSETIETHLSQHTVKKLQTIKRLPWTQNILEKTQDLAEKLAHHSPFHSEMLVKKESYLQAELPHRNFFMATPTLRSSSPPDIQQESLKKIKLQHRFD